MTPAIPYGCFRRGFLTLKCPAGVNKDNVSLVDIGDINLTANGRSYQVDIDRHWAFFDTNENGSVDEIEFQFNFGTFEDAQECFDECPFDLTLADLNDPDLKTSMYFGSDEDGIELTLKSGELIFLDPNDGETYSITINDGDA